jgi:hypothetical protein
MPLDPSIILGAKAPQFDLAQFSPINTLMTAMKFKQLDQEGELNALTLKERKNLQTFMSENPDLSKPETRYKLASQFGETGRKIATSVTDIGKSETEEAKRRADLVVSKTGLYRDALRDVNDQRGALKWLQTQQQDPDMLGSPVTKVSIMDAARAIPADPAGFADWKNKAALGLSEYIKQNKPVTFAQDLGPTGRILSRGGLGGEATVVPGSEYTKGKTFADLTAERQASTSAGQLGLAQRKFAWEQANPGYEIKEAEDGSIVGVNKRTLQAFPVSLGGPAPAATPTGPVAGTGMPGARAPAASAVVPAIPGMTSVLDQTAPAAAPAAGVPLRGKGTALTETQSNATAFGLRMKEANSILTSLEKSGVKNTGLISNVAGSIVGVVPLIGDKLTGMTESVFNVLPQIMGGLSPEQQQVAQARLNFITANLRKESGATLLPSEFITEEKKYFPKPGDDATVIAQKQKARNLALKAMEIQAGPGAKNIQQYQTGVADGGGGAIPNATPTNPLGLTIPGVR